ncbi:MAG: 16S rRNA (cytosine(1402)-N(4))-methyltransferase RsmH [Candidatus Levybacteria bacterium]|nr:16S rRNA (cytosine(1402)-N(4))-methyltransferase RsmH [Candidatus Levybacteria bacterium]
MENNSFHTPVLLREVLDLLQIKNGEKYIDATLGGGGHTFEILKLGGKVLGIDCDQDAIGFVKFKIQNSKFKIEEDIFLFQGNFRDIDKIAHLKKFTKVSGIILDLGLSSYQLRDKTRGFSFQQEGPLDMRMNRNLQVRAENLVNILTKGELYELFSKLGEEHRARSIAEHIVRARRVKTIQTTSELSRIVEEAYGVKKRDLSLFEKQKINKKVFQALRMAVNDELNSLKIAIPKALGLLKENGRLGVISFHSLEDRIVKKAFIEYEKLNMGRIITKKPIVPSEDEIRKNRRSKSAKLRFFEKLS